MEWKHIQGMVVACEEVMYCERVFVHAVGGERSHMEVMGTVIDHEALKKVLTDLFPRYSEELWQEAIDEWGRDGKFKFLSRVLALAVTRYRKRYLHPGGDLHHPLSEEK